jgi:hypothetical protein
VAGDRFVQPLGRSGDADDTVITVPFTVAVPAG